MILAHIHHGYTTAAFGILALFLVNQSTATPVSAPEYAQVGIDSRDMKRGYIDQDVEAWVEHHLGPWLTD